MSSTPASNDVRPKPAPRAKRLKKRTVRKPDGRYLIYYEKIEI